jgi:transposase
MELMMSASDQLKWEVVSKYESGKLSVATACKLLDVSTRSLRRYVQRYRQRGLGFVQHGNKRRKPKNMHPPEIKAAMQRLMKEVFFDFNMSHAQEKIREQLGLDVPRETFRRWCHEIGMVKQKQKRRSKPRFRRHRQLQSGLLVQFDGSHHKWFGTEETCLLAAIDDATSELIYAEFCPGETTIDCLRVLKQIVEKKGVFKALYVDRAGLYGGFKRQGFSQVSRALEELGTHVIYAQSPEGKGRVERLFRTLQDRLIPELRINNITSMQTANRYLNEIYLRDNKARFMIKSTNPETAYRPIQEHTDLQEIFCQKEFRTMAKDHTLSLFGERWMVVDPLRVSIANQRIEIRLKESGPEAYFAGRLLSLLKIKKAA